MTLRLDCGKVNPDSGCTKVVEAENEQELMQQVAAHAKEDHGIDEVSPEMAAKVRGHIERV